LKREIRGGPASSSEAMVKVSMGTFVRSSFESRLGSDVANSLRGACVHYSRRLRSGRKPRAVPAFYRGLGNGTTNGNGAAQVVEFALRDPIRVQLEEEARRQRVPLDDLILHAALIYLADLDAAAL
jgi:hypothetical protein